MDFERIWEGFWVTFGIFFRTLYPMGFQVRSEKDFGRILVPKGLQIRRLNFRELVLEAILVPLGPQDGGQRSQEASKKAPEASKKAPEAPKKDSWPQFSVLFEAKLMAFCLFASRTGPKITR